MTGLFISFEGVDGVGKTTQVERLRAALEAAGREVVVTREPGGTPLGQAIRSLLLHGVPSEETADPSARMSAPAGGGCRRQPTGGGSAAGDIAAPADIAPRAEALLFAADRAQHVAEVIRPALDRGAVVITDRYLDSSLAYQAGGRELTAAEIRELSMWGTNGLLPDRTYLLDMDPALSHSRLTHDEDRMESAGDDFQRRTREAFLALAAAEPDRFRVIDASQPIDAVWTCIERDVEALAAGGEPR
ncbi:dTMP kinase [Bifidobacterium parmae]|uniref:Thymidylate kinase n=1 Tax=Bifidobacterium parmae TaxID=361854 RepID=A0A2N5IW39_9BIFI|nr:dTMP kinase [Bifidobacterium parmae]PLS26179.1 thymidylate kinase [Bifidobacterium parmae]